MGIQQHHILGREEKVFIVPSALLTTAPTAPAATDAIRVLKTTMERKRNRKDRMDKANTRDRVERYSGRVEASWSIEKYLLPSGVAGTAPDDHYLLTSGFGVQTVNGGTSVVYSLNNVQAPVPRGIWRHGSDGALEFAQGALVEEITISASGDAESKIKYSGPCREIYRMGGVITSTTGESSSANHVTLTSGHGDRIFDGAMFEFEISGGGRNNNSGAGYQVTGHNSADEVAVTPNLGAALIAGGNVWPYTPDETTAGSPIDGVIGSLTVGGVALAIQSMELTVKNNLLLENDRYGTPYLADANFGRREVFGKFTLRARRDMLFLLIEADSFVAQAITAVLGSAAGSIYTWQNDQAELDTSNLDIPEGNDGAEATFEVPFTALGTANNEDSVTLTQT